MDFFVLMNQREVDSRAATWCFNTSIIFFQHDFPDFASLQEMIQETFKTKLYTYSMPPMQDCIVVTYRFSKYYCCFDGDGKATKASCHEIIQAE